jgi:hypothetical protein
MKPWIVSNVWAHLVRNHVVCTLVPLAKHTEITLRVRRISIRAQRDRSPPSGP